MAQLLWEFCVHNTYSDWCSVPKSYNILKDFFGAQQRPSVKVVEGKHALNVHKLPSNQ